MLWKCKKTYQAHTPKPNDCQVIAPSSQRVVIVITSCATNYEGVVTEITFRFQRMIRTRKPSCETAPPSYECTSGFPENSRDLVGHLFNDAIWWRKNVFKLKNYRCAPTLKMNHAKFGAVYQPTKTLAGRQLIAGYTRPRTLIGEANHIHVYINISGLCLNSNVIIVWDNHMYLVPSSTPCHYLD